MRRARPIRLPRLPERLTLEGQGYRPADLDLPAMPGIVDAETVALPRPPRKRTGQGPEAKLQRAVLDRLEALGILHWRQNAGLARSMDGRRVIRAGIEGLPDVIAIVGGKPVGLELKAKAGRLREAQAAMRGRWTAAGGTYAVVRSLLDLEVVLAGLGVPGAGRNLLALPCPVQANPRAEDVVCAPC